MVLKKVKQTILEHELIKPGEKVILGISGGHDSTALLDILVKLKEFLHFDLILAHVNYGFRGRQADEDEEFVCRLAKKYRLKIFVKKLTPKDYPKNENLEDFFRQVRYSFFEEVLKKEGAHKIATAHTLDDQVETILMFFLRGAGEKGLSGMDYQRGKIIRPLLDISRKEISQYLKGNKLPWRHDVTNEDINFTRNKIRHKLIPFLEKEFNPNLKNTLKMMAKIFRENNEAWKLILKKFFQKSVKIEKNKVEINLKKFLDLPLAFQRKVILEVLALFEKKISFVFLEDILKMIKEGSISAKKVVDNLQILKKRDKIIFEKS